MGNMSFVPSSIHYDSWVLSSALDKDIRVSSLLKKKD